ncbi:MAG: AAA family ATPase, partial [Candidatus Sericytochromatia bacterium]
MISQNARLIFEGSHSLIFLTEMPEYAGQVIVKVLKKDQATLQEIVQFNNEYEYTTELQIPGIRKAHRKTRFNHLSALILEYIEGRTLRQRLQEQALSVPQVLDIALQICQTLGEIHRLGIIHKDLNPANILIESGTGVPWLIDFGLAAKWGLKVPHLNHPHHLEGTLAYLSPEQTGRMNRVVDYRSDLYSFGVSLYEMLTGQLPFSAQDSIGWVHAHIARPPLPPHEVNGLIPEALSRIVLKLMAKNAEDRYQSAFGLKKDLEKLVCEPQTIQYASGFELGLDDYPARLQIPQKLYGRQRETAALLATFERISRLDAPQAGMMLVSGYSGVGKTALVYQLHKPITEKRGYFISGKFDQLQRNIPYSVFTQAFTQLCDYLLTENEAELAGWRQRILDQVGNNGQVLIDIIPRLERIIGPQPPVPALAPKEAQNRFNLYFGYFIKAISRADQPLVIFIDDLQWADLASLELLKLLFAAEHAGRQPLLLIGAYRDNEVTPRHPFMLTLAEIRAAGARIDEIHIGNLSEADLATLLGETLASPAGPAEIAELLALLYEKTLGNAFFVNQFLQSLYDEQELVFDFAARHWRWDIAKIKARGFTDNVITFMANKIGRLPENTQQVLMLAACIGSEFDLSTLITIAERPAQVTAQAVQDALVEGLITPLQDIYQLRLLVTDDLQRDLHEKYKFIHDRVQQAAYALIQGQDKPGLHHRIGRLLLASDQPAGAETRLFDIVEHLHLGLSLVTDPAQKREIAALSLQAGQRARLSSAFESAFRYLRTGINCLAPDSWQSDYELSFQLYLDAIEAAFVSGDFANMETLSEQALQAAGNLLDRVRIYELTIAWHHAQYRLEQAVMTGLDVLEMLGISLPRDPQGADLMAALGETSAKLAGRTPEELMALPLMSEPSKAAAIRVMYLINLSAFFFRPLLYPVLVCKEVALMAEYGNVPESAFVYSTYGMILSGVVKDIELGYAFGRISRQLLELPGAKPVECRTLMVLGNGVLHWKDSNHDLLPSYLESYKTGLETGDLEFAAQAAHSYCFMGLYAGVELKTLNQDMAHYLRVIENLKAATTLQYMRIYYQFALKLYTPPLPGEPPHLMKGDVYDEAEMLPIHQEAKDYTALCVLYFSKLMLAYLFEDYENALAFSLKAQETLDSILCVAHIAIYHAYDSLTRLALCQAEDTAPDAAQSRAEHLEKVRANQVNMKLWADHGPGNYLHKYLLVEAETARVLGQTDQAIALYEQAIETARNNRYLNDEALANECCGRFWLGKGSRKLAAIYLQEALRLYWRWGASEKARQLESRYVGLLQPPGPPPELLGSSHLLSSSHLESQFKLDYLTLLKSTRAISQEINLEALLARLLDIVLENAGAEKGCLLLPYEGQLLIAAGCEVGGEPQIFAQAPLAQQSEVPQAVIQYVLRSGENLVLDDALHDERFGADELIA